MNRFLRFFFLYIITTNARAQQDDYAGYDQKIENIAEKNEYEDADYTDVLQNLNYYKQHPLNLNIAKQYELQSLYLLSDIEISNLQDHIEKNGKLLSLYELQSIDGFDLQTINKILPFVTISDQEDFYSWRLSEILKKGNHNFLLRDQQILEKQKGYAANQSSNFYLGNNQKLYTRYRFNYQNRISAGITAEKDAGEEFFQGSQKQGFDFYSAHFCINNLKHIKSLAVGDYRLSYGQGLVAWSGLSVDKSADVINIKKNQSGIMPYLSADENRFMRGIATTFTLNKIEASLFLSKKKIDANILHSYTSTDNQVTSILNSGYHRTSSEIENKDVLDETIMGGNLSYQSGRFHAGITSMNTFLSSSLMSNGKSYNQFDFSSNKLSNCGIDYSWNIRNFNLLGEAAVSDNGGLAYLSGIQTVLDPRLSVALLYRNYQKNYQALYRNAFSENSNAVNENGFYFGVNSKITNQLTVNFYYDRFSFPWLKYLVNRPSYGNDLLVQVNYTPSKKVDMYMRFRQHNRFKNINTQHPISFPVSYAQLNYRYHISYSISNSIRLANRVEVVSIGSASKEMGYMIYQDIRYKQFGKKLALAARYVLFSTDSYTSRIYAYESDLTNSYSVPAYYYKGSRAYIMAIVDISKSIELQLHYGQLVYDNQKKISKGSLNEINGNKKSEAKIQALLRF